MQVYEIAATIHITISLAGRMFYILQPAVGGTDAVFVLNDYPDFANIVRYRQGGQCLYPLAGRDVVEPNRGCVSQ